MYVIPPKRHDMRLRTPKGVYRDYNRDTRAHPKGRGGGGGGKGQARSPRACNNERGPRRVAPQDVVQGRH